MIGIIKAQTQLQGKPGGQIPFDPNDESLGQSWDKVKQWAKTTGSPQLKKYLEKAWQYASPVVKTLGKPLDNAIDKHVTNPVSNHKEGFKQYQQMLQTVRRFFEFGNINTKFVTELYNHQIMLRNESRRIAQINNELQRYLKNGEFMLTNESADLMDKFIESHNQIEETMGEIHKLAEGLFDQVSNFPIEKGKNIDLNKVKPVQF